MAVLRQLDGLIERARKLSDHSRVTLTGELEELRNAARYCLEELGPMAHDALAVVSRLEFTPSKAGEDPKEFEAKGYQSLATLQKWLETVKGRTETGQHSHERPTPRRFPTPPNAAWPDVRIRFVSDHQVQVWVGDNSEARNYSEMGFEDRRNGLPDSSWEVLRQLAERRGAIKRSSEAGVDRWSKVEKAIQKIRERFRLVFEIEDDPFEPFHRVHCYKTKFQIKCSESYKG
ncbi:MAG: hypothetical protein L0338_22515 [Acidobacteria bacterium]|nr:hypothetical protein [Acidobacteriota bacterium]